MSKGDIVLVPFPFTDLSGQKIRPALVLHSTQVSEDCVLVFISSVNKKRVGRFDVKVAPSVHNGLKTESVIKTDKIATLQKKIAIGELGKLEKTYLKDIEKKLKLLFQL